MQFARNASYGSVLAALACVLLSACASKPLAEPVAAPEGEVGFRVLAPESEGRHEVLRGQAASGGKLLDQSVVLPDYPPDWLPRRLPAVIADALVVVDTQGRAERVEVDQAALRGQCDDCAEAFALSVEQAVLQWTFAPLEIADWIDGPDEDGDGVPDSVVRSVVATRPYSLRLRFSFFVRDGRGVVERVTDA